MLLSFWFEVALMHIPYAAEYIYRNKRTKFAFEQVAYGISYSVMVDKCVGLTSIIICRCSKGDALSREFFGFNSRQTRFYFELLFRTVLTIVTIYTMQLIQR